VKIHKARKTARTMTTLSLRHPTITKLLNFVLVLLAIFVVSAEAWTTQTTNTCSKPTTQRTTDTCLNMGSSSTTTNNPKPKLPIPDPICSTEPGTWAYDTMSRRVNEEILQRTYEDIQEDLETPEFATIKKRFEALREELRNAAKRPVTYLDPLPEDASAERQKEWAEWKQILEPFVSKDDTWLSAPWMVTEFYVYRRLMQAIGYWDKGTPGYMYDSFVKQKQAGLYSSVGSAEPMLARIPNLPPNAEGIALAASIALWGNKMDLSIWPANADNTNVDVFSEVLASASENLLHDDSTKLAAHCDKLRHTGGGNVDIIVDNAGFELITDLALAQYLVQSGIAKCVTFQLKSHPTFVSDALEKDLLEHVEHYANLNAKDFPSAQAAGALWKEFLEKGQWKCVEDNFWVQAFAMWDMTEPLRSDMKSRCDLAFVKGDANYRRLLGDCVWDYTAPFEDVVGCYFPCPVCALRTLKAEIGCGMDADQVERAKGLDDNWMVNGRFGVVHFGKGADK